MATNPNTAARDYFSTSEKSLLEDYGVTSAEFDRVRQDDRTMDLDRSSGSQMVKDDKPALELNPPKELAQDVDRDAFDRKWAEELQRAQERAPEQDNTHEPEREYSR